MSVWCLGMNTCWVSVRAKCLQLRSKHPYRASSGSLGLHSFHTGTKSRRVEPERNMQPCVRHSLWLLKCVQQEKVSFVCLRSLGFAPFGRHVRHLGHWLRSWVTSSRSVPLREFVVHDEDSGLQVCVATNLTGGTRQEDCPDGCSAPAVHDANLKAVYVARPLSSFDSDSDQARCKTRGSSGARVSADVLQKFKRTSGPTSKLPKPPTSIDNETQ